MHTYLTQSCDTQSKPVSGNSRNPKNTSATFQPKDNHPQSLGAKELRALVLNSPQAQQAAQLQRIAGGYSIPLQPQEKVKPTSPQKGVEVKDDATVEREVEMTTAGAFMPSRSLTSAKVPESKLSTSHGMPVQCKVGFEFQAYNSVTYVDPTNCLKPIMTKVVGQGKGFKVEKDNGATNNEMELVTDAVDETDAGRDQLTGQMSSIQHLVGKIEDKKKVTSLGETGDIQWEDNIEGYFLAVRNGVNFHPQATVGVKFSKIPELIEHLTSASSLSVDFPKKYTPFSSSAKEMTEQFGWSGRQDQQLFKAAWKNGLAKARSHFRDTGTPVSESALGIAAFLFGFAKYSSLNTLPEDKNLIKYFMPFMPRMGLLPYYQTLSGEDRRALCNIPSEIRDQKLIPPQCDEMRNAKTDANTVGKLLEGLERGEDFQDIGGFSFIGYGQSKPEELGMKDKTDIGPDDRDPDRKGAILELRKLGSEVPGAHLTNFALAVFDLIRLIHASALPIAAPEAPPAPPPGTARREPASRRRPWCWFCIGGRG